jgi:hypothetical protein
MIEGYQVYCTFWRGGRSFTEELSMVRDEDHARLYIITLYQEDDELGLDNDYHYLEIIRDVTNDDLT